MLDGMANSLIKTKIISRLLFILPALKPELEKSTLQNGDKKTTKAEKRERVEDD